MRIAFLIVISMLFKPALSADSFFDSLLGGTEMEESNPGNAQIPDRRDGSVIQFTTDTQNPRRQWPENSDQIGFDPFHDAADFTNFASATVENGRLIRKRDVNGGTCFGISYFTHIWHSRLILPVQKGGETRWVRFYDNQVSLWEALTRVNNNTATAALDGVNMVTRKILQEKVDARETEFFNPQVMRDNLPDYRLFSMSNGEYKEDIKKGTIAHHRDQLDAEKVEVDTRSASKNRSFLAKVKERISAHGSMLFYFTKYKVFDEWYLWNKREWGHACLIYAIDEIEVKDSEGNAQPAYAIRYYDPNKRYRHQPESGEAYGSYLIYFRNSDQISFSKAAQSMYGIQQRSSVIDNDEVILGYYDLYEGHPAQEEIARDNFFEGDVEDGHVLSSEESAALQNSEKIKIEESEEE